MIWPFRTKRAPVIEHTADMDQSGLDEARQARRESEADLRKIQGQRSKVEKVAEELRELQVTDQLAMLFESSIRKRERE